MCQLVGLVGLQTGLVTPMRVVEELKGLTMSWPSGENATDLTKDVCPVKGPAAVSPVVTFHI
jgi:hypothetical protein